ncbi:hypothetical protein CROQUDRAFT_521024 [Cronartium quercuum f. sp. fusiforme G11]|uniref:Uncharacterized protein n=1 Tax=Cronartium quercuum f. sp. fusiforme G11 TaxID=708437 RepID=A0A9P6NIV2_9BASI|nr:hypothetical protein CROQUDRAFT_521024 [Cronartium quercuum f. sp. fusiforme G11]
MHCFYDNTYCSAFFRADITTNSPRIVSGVGMWATRHSGARIHLCVPPVVGITTLSDARQSNRQYSQNVVYVSNRGETRIQANAWRRTRLNSATDRKMETAPLGRAGRMRGFRGSRSNVLLFLSFYKFYMWVVRSLYRKL